MGRRMKHTDIGDIPADWKLQTFEETFRVLSNNTLSRENLNNKGGAVRNIHYGDILTKFPEVLNCNEEDIPYLNDLSLITANTQLLQDGDIVIADTAEDETVGKTIEVQNLGDGKLVAGLHTIPCRVKKGNFAPGWLGYYMNSYIYHDQIIPFITGIKVSSISKTAIAETIILVPPVEEQERIVETLSQLDSLIKQETSVSEKLNNVKSSCLSKMFPKDDEKKPEMRFPEFTDAWEQRKLSDTLNFLSNNTLSRAELSEDTGTYKNVHYGDVLIKFGEYIDAQSTDLPYIADDEKAKKFESSKLQDGDIIIADTAEDEAVGKCVEIGNIGDLSIVSGLHTIPCRPKVKFAPAYLGFYLNSASYHDQLIPLMQGIKVTSISKSAISDTLISAPTDLSEQGKIGQFFSQLDSLITLHQRELHKLQIFKKSMPPAGGTASMPNPMNEYIRVTTRAAGPAIQMLTLNLSDIEQP